MPGLQEIQAIITDPQYHDYLAILKGARNGFVYGTKVRFPHALIMAILFGRGDWQTRLKVIFRATKQHAFNLAKFVSLYKTFLLLQKKLNGGKERPYDTFFAGLLGGYIVFGERNAINEQIVLYVCSRVVRSLHPPCGLALRHVLDRRLRREARPPGLANRGESIQPGMFNSMRYLYRDSEAWTNLRTLIWHNT
ncbi:hypothetical protein EWM64_g1947 [Hericium alpestre]|uniref:Peroxisomal membrane protein 4 n=1 Tax=Hericium alpestre TaxID=135208 RepID=A0A4Z0A6V2_9AGAM|nr:hypothetical protein EWM64_g1947 [Hericium alpestre]